MNNTRIEPTKAFKFGNTAYLTREEAQHAAIMAFFNNCKESPNYTFPPEQAVGLIMSHKDEIVAILTGDKPRRARSDKGKAHAKPKKLMEMSSTEFDRIAAQAMRNTQTTSV